MSFCFVSLLRRPDTVKQKNAFPPNFIHSLDSTHMMLTALHCYRYHLIYWERFVFFLSFWGSIFSFHRTGILTGVIIHDGICSLHMFSVIVYFFFYLSLILIPACGLCLLLSVLVWHLSQFTTVSGPTPSLWAPWTRYYITVQSFFSLPPVQLFASCLIMYHWGFEFSSFCWWIKPKVCIVHVSQLSDPGFSTVYIWKRRVIVCFWKL